MASSDSSGGGPSQSPKLEATTFDLTFTRKIPRRHLTLISITVCLNFLLWSSLFVFITSLYLIASDPDGTTNIPTEVLTLVSSLVSISYIIIHTIFSLKQRIWKHQRRHPSIVKKTSYIAVRIAVTLCVLWLLTSGWNMIVVARRPVCLPDGPGLARWEAGTTCVVGRAGVAISLIALIASCTLFGMLATIRRPFEAHVFKHGYQEPVNPHPTPAVSRRPSPTRSGSFTPEYYQRHVSTSTHRSSPSNVSNTDVETIDLNSHSPPTTIHAPSPVRSIGLGIFTSHAQPPPLPAGYIPLRSTSLESSPPIFYPSASYHLPPPPRMSSMVAPSGFVPLSIPVQYSASAWRAVHPTLPSPLGRSASRSNPHLPPTASGHAFSYRSRYSRSSVSLTRPNRLSSATPVGSVAWSSRSGSTGPGDEGRGSPASGSLSGRERASASAIAYLILNSSNKPGAEPQRNQKVAHARRASAPDTTTGAEQQGRMAKGWKPQLQGQQDGVNNHPLRIIRSSSAELLSKFSPDSSPEDNSVNLRRELERELESVLSHASSRPLRRSRSESPLRHSDIPGGTTHVNRVTMISRMPQNPRMPKHADTGAGAQQSRRMTYDELKNKPLPRIAAL